MGGVWGRLALWTLNPTRSLVGVVGETMLRGCFGGDAARLSLMTAVFARWTLILAFLNKLTEPTLRFIIRIEGADHEPEVLFR